MYFFFSLKAVLQYQKLSYVLLYAMGIVGERLFFLCIFQCGVSSALSNARDESGTLLARLCTSFLALRFESHVRLTCSFSLSFIVWLNIVIALWYCDLY